MRGALSRTWRATWRPSSPPAPEAAPLPVRLLRCAALDTSSARHLPLTTLPQLCQGSSRFCRM